MQPPLHTALVTLTSSCPRMVLLLLLLVDPPSDAECSPLDIPEWSVDGTRSHCSSRGFRFFQWLDAANLRSDFQFSDGHQFVGGFIGSDAARTKWLAPMIQEWAACQGCLLPPDRVHRNDAVTSVRVPVPAVSPAGLGRRISADRGSDSQSLLPGTCPHGSTSRDRDSQPMQHGEGFLQSLCQLHQAAGPIAPRWDRS